MLNARSHFTENMAFVQTQRVNPSNGSVNGFVNNGSASNGSVSNSSVNNDSVTNGSVTNGSVSNRIISNGTVSNGFVNNGTVSNGAINNSAFSNSTIMSSAINNSAINNSAINSGAVNNGTINNPTISNGAINGNAINNSAINNGAINNNAINNSAINNSAISSGTFNNGAITSGTANNRTISNGAINNGVLNSGINNNNSAINSDAINNRTINNGTINNSTFNNGTINNSTVNNGTINNSTINNGTVNNRTISSDAIRNRTSSSGTSSSGTNITTASPVWPSSPPAVIGPTTSTLPSTVALTPPQIVTPSQVSTTSPVTGPTTSSMTPSVVDCPDLNGSITNNSSSSSSTSSNNNSNKSGGSTRKTSLHLSTNERKRGTVVEAECLVPKIGPHNVTYLQCQENGAWNSSLPECSDSFQFSTFQLYFSVAGCVFGLTMLVLAALICYALKLRRNISSSSDDSNEESEKTIYVDPYYVTEAITRPPPRGNFGRREATYAKPVVYTTYLNQSFYEDAYDRWRTQEQSVSERLYDSPWARPRGLKSQMDTPDFKWSQSNLRNLGESGFKRLPRAQLSVDHASIKSNDSIGPAGSTYSRDPLLNQSAASARKMHPPKRRYPASPDSISQTHVDNTVTGCVQDDLDASGHLEFDNEFKDGLTNF